MDIHKIMQTGKIPDDLEAHLLELDSEFRFKCRRCGKCCIHQDTILFNTRDIYSIAKKKGMTMQQVVESYTEVYIGGNSRIPIVHLLSNGPKGACPLLADGRCSVHDCKPTVCALFPLGRVVMGEKIGEPIEDLDKLQVKYILNDYRCGSAKRVNTVRSWLAKFGIAEHDEFYLLWNKVVMSLTPTIMKLEKHKVSVPVLNMFWDAIFQTLYLQYDVTQDLMPQFQAAADKLLHLSREIMKAEPPAIGTPCQS
jgi:Fe-S-cluster containining protein